MLPSPLPVPNQATPNTGTAPTTMAPTTRRRSPGRQATVMTRAAAIPTPRLIFTRENRLSTPPSTPQTHSATGSSRRRPSAATHTIRTRASTSSTATLSPKYLALTSEMPPTR